MKKIIITAIALIALCTSSMAQKTDEESVKAAVEALRVAMVDANKSALENLTADDLSYGHSSGQIENKQEFVEKIATGKSDFVSINLEDQTIKVTGDAAIVRHKLKGETNNDGKPGTVSLSVLLVWQKQNGKWKLLARQAVKI